LNDQETVIMVNELLASVAGVTTNYQKDKAALDAYFTVDTASSATWCGKLGYQLVSQDMTWTDPNGYVDLTDPTTPSLNVNKLQAVNTLILLEVKSKG